jgi:aminoglycoside phosphotransferase (APT) family kinase protein
VIRDWARTRLAPLIAEATGSAGAAVTGIAELRGGAVRRHWRVDAEVGGKSRSFVLRSDGATALGMGLALADEFALLEILHTGGRAVAPPLLYCADPALTGAPFHVTEFLDGSADPATLVASGPHAALAKRLGRELAAVQGIDPPFTLFGAPPAEIAAQRIAAYRARLDAMGEARPVAEWAMRRLLRDAPAPLPPVLCHGDFRTGNYLAEGGRFVALIDWEFAGWGDPDEDLAWFCSRCWRFGAPTREAGGIAARADLHRGYESASGRCLDPARLRYWEAMAALKWLVVALLQRDRYLRAGERSLDLALTGRRAAECELELLRLTAEPEDHARSA